MMARVFDQAQAKRLGLAGRASLEIVSGEQGSRAVTLRLVEIPVQQPGEIPRGPHLHRDVEECIFVLSGTGTTHTENGEHTLKPGDTILVPAGEKHVTRNTGSEPLMLLCFFPVADVASRTQEAFAKSGNPAPAEEPGRCAAKSMRGL
jgi:quercetin dioxygenase-like cupin family protein